jgi:hypothetical protein
MAVANWNETDFAAFRADQAGEDEFMASADEIAAQASYDAGREIG